MHLNFKRSQPEGRQAQGQVFDPREIHGIETEPALVFETNGVAFTSFKHVNNLGVLHCIARGSALVAWMQHGDRFPSQRLHISRALIRVARRKSQRGWR